MQLCKPEPDIAANIDHKRKGDKILLDHKIDKNEKCKNHLRRSQLQCS